MLTIKNSSVKKEDLLFSDLASGDLFRLADSDNPQAVAIKCMEGGGYTWLHTGHHVDVTSNSNLLHRKVRLMKQVSPLEVTEVL